MFILVNRKKKSLSGVNICNKCTNRLRSLISKITPGLYKFLRIFYQK